MKRKVWDITVKDNPNRVVMGENDEFYTTDTEAYLVFELEDKNFNPATAVLTLENRNDGSLKNETVDVVDGLIEWEMPQRYIEHFGNWQGQLVYEDTKDGQPELYTSAPFTFVVNAHIGDKKMPSLVEIENWEKFIRDGTELIETWEDMEDLRQANEAQRQANYQELLDTGVLQTNINTKLEALEEEYAPRLNEVTAQLAQKANKEYTDNQLSTKRDKAKKIELEDASETFLGAMSGNATFNVLSTPQDGSVAPEKLDYKLNDSLLYPIENIVVNGNFDNELDESWTAQYANLSVQDNILTSTGTTSYAPVLRHYTEHPITVGNKIFIKFKMRFSDVANLNLLRVRMMSSGGGIRDVAKFNEIHPQLVAGEWYEFTVMDDIPDTFSGTFTLYFQTGYSDPGMGKVMELSEVIIIDVTDSYGKGREPSKEELMEYLNNTFVNGWFDKKANLFNAKETHHTIERLANDTDALNKSADLYATNMNDADFITKGWGTIGGTASYDDGILTTTGDGTHDYIGASFDGTYYFSSNDVRVIYMAVSAKVLDAECNELQLFARDDLGRRLINHPVASPEMGKEYRVSQTIKTDRFDGEYGRARIYAVYEDSNIANGKKMELRKPVMIDLTETFGAGNEPSAKEMDAILNAKYIDGYFLGTENIFSQKGIVGVANKELQSHRDSYLRMSDGGVVEAKSTRELYWPDWKLPKWSFGFDPRTARKPHQILGNVEIKEGMLHLYTEDGRWNSDYYDQPTDGGHFLNAWNKSETYRASFLMGYTYTDELCIQTYASPKMLGEEQTSGVFGTVRLGSDMRDKGTVIGEHTFQIEGSHFRISKPKTPSSSTAEGERGEIAWDNNYVYVCVQDNTWKRTTLETW